MKRLNFTGIALLATAALAMAAPTKDEMMAKEQAAWQAFKEKNAADFKKVVHADFVGVYDDGIADMQKELADMQKWDMKSFTISDYKVVQVGADTMMSSYKVSVEGTYGGQDASGKFNAGSVWRNQKGEWQAIFHTNVKEAAGGASPAGSP